MIAWIFLSVIKNKTLVTPAPTPAPAPDSVLVDTLKQMQQTLQQMQLANIGAADSAPPRSDDDIASDFLAAIINPPTPNKKED